MLISDLEILISKEDPCIEGYKWFLKESKGCKTAIDFFKKCKNNYKNQYDCIGSPHGYLTWIFGNCLDWTKICGSENCYWYNEIKNYNKLNIFLKNNFNAENIHCIDLNDLCDALIRAFE